MGAVTDLARTRSPFARERVPKVFYSYSFRDRKVCDVGCGEGAKALHALRSGAYVVAVDLDVEVLLQLRGTGLDLVHATAEALPLRDNACDAAILWNVLMFVNDEDATLREIRRVTRNDVLISVYAVRRRRYTRSEFLDIVYRLGAPQVVRLGDRQSYAIVRVVRKA
ncbi:class I SAM-dependent methyltransferase [Pyrobaculum sp.]|uniref:class I SAM-dependent methyltransferase n=1 Tax=Pyrobaculum sp. TaxID=2004705 RepID=UPI003D0E7B94